MPSKPSICEFCGSDFSRRSELTSHRKECPRPDDPGLRRTCNRCGRVRAWVVAICRCGCPEFTVPDTHEERIE